MFLQFCLVEVQINCSNALVHNEIYPLDEIVGGGNGTLLIANRFCNTVLISIFYKNNICYYRALILCTFMLQLLVEMLPSEYLNETVIVYL